MIYMDVVYDPDFGAIAVATNEAGEVVGTGVDSPR